MLALTSDQYQEWCEGTGRSDGWCVEQGFGKYVMQSNKNNDEDEQIEIPQWLFNVSLGFM